MKKISESNDTKIKFIRVHDALFTVDRISFFNFSVEAHHTDLTFADVPEEEVFDITELRDFRIKLHNFSGTVIDFQNYVRNRVNSVSKKDFQILKVP